MINGESERRWPHGKQIRLVRRFPLGCTTEGHWQSAGTSLRLERETAGWTFSAADAPWAAFLFRAELHHETFSTRRAAVRALSRAVRADEQLLR